MRTRFLSLLIIAALALGACQPGAGRTSDGRLGVVATFSVIADLVRVVGGDAIALTTLVGPGQDTHTFSPSASDAARLARAQLVFENGLAFEPWLDDLYAAGDASAPRAVASDGIDLIEAAGEEGIYDPHVWHSAANAMRMVENIRDALAQADPANAEAYRANAEAYLAELQALDAWVFDQAGALPEERRLLVTTHDTFGYFAQRYGFEVLGTVMPTTTEGASPSAQQLAALVEAMRASGVPAVFAETVSSNGLLDQAAAEAGVTVIATLDTDALGPAGSESDTYLKMMRHNVTTIVEALQG